MAPTPRFVVVTGLSGAGKSQALRTFEDMGYFCVDNLPAALAPTFAELAIRSEAPVRNVAVCVDARSGDLDSLPAHLERVRALGFGPEVLFLESQDKVLVRRYSESRRRHPASPTGSIEEGICRERALLAPLRDRADLVLDTSSLSAAELRERISDTFVGLHEHGQLVITVMSFGFKYGLPPEADMVLDLRFLPNPYYDAELRPLTGRDPEARDYVLNMPAAQEFLQHVKSLLKFLIPKYTAEPKTYLTIALGCTGGRHRSVTLAEEVLRVLRDMKYDARLRHRDINRDDYAREE